MTSITAIICEYNPFHNGHAAQIARLRVEFPGGILLCIMSGNFTQRGEPALMPAAERARAALSGGADLVVELPQPWASGSAEFFAAGGVSIAERLGAERLAFGCESEDLSAPMCMAQRIAAPEFAALLARPSDLPGEGEAARIARLWAETYGDDGGMLSAPNNLLAVQYCLAILRSRASIRPHPMRREGSGYASASLDHVNPSATAVRAAIRRGEPLDSLADYLPPATLSVLREAIAAGRAPVYPEAIGQAVLAFYRLAAPEALEAFASMRGGLAHRLSAAARDAVTAEDMLSRAATKVYTNSRIRRAVLQGMLGVTEDDLRRCPAYVRLLAASPRGRQYLSSLRHKDTLPVVTRVSDIPAGAGRQRALAERADALYTLGLPTPLASGKLLGEVPFFFN